MFRFKKPLSMSREAPREILMAEKPIEHGAVAISTRAPHFPMPGIAGTVAVQEKSHYTRNYQASGPIQTRVNAARKR